MNDIAEDILKTPLRAIGKALIDIAILPSYKKMFEEINDYCGIIYKDLANLEDEKKITIIKERMSDNVRYLNAIPEPKNSAIFSNIDKLKGSINSLIETGSDIHIPYECTYDFVNHKHILNNMYLDLRRYEWEGEPEKFFENTKAIFFIDKLNNDNDIIHWVEQLDKWSNSVDVHSTRLESDLKIFIKNFRNQSSERKKQSLVSALQSRVKHLENIKIHMFTNKEIDRRLILDFRNIIIYINDPWRMNRSIEEVVDQVRAILF